MRVRFWKGNTRGCEKCVRHGGRGISKARSHFPICALRARIDREFSPKTVDQKLSELRGFADFLYPKMLWYFSIKCRYTSILDENCPPAYAAPPILSRRFCGIHYVKRLVRCHQRLQPSYFVAISFRSIREKTRKPIRSATDALWRNGFVLSFKSWDTNLSRSLRKTGGGVSCSAANHLCSGLGAVTIGLSSIARSLLNRRHPLCLMVERSNGPAL